MKKILCGAKRCHMPLLGHQLAILNVFHKVDGWVEEGLAVLWVVRDKSRASAW